MDSEANVIVRRPNPANTVTLPSQTTRTESTAVFVGRSSFQMVPAVIAARQSSSGVPAAPLSAGRTTTQPIIVEDRVEARAEARVEIRAEGRLQDRRAEGPETWAPESADHVILTPPPVVQGFPGRTSGAPSSSSAVPRLFSTAEVTEPIQATPLGGRTRRAGVSRRTVRTIVVALLAGATLTLSAEAVMRRPASTNTVAQKAKAPVSAPRAPMAAVAVSAHQSGPAPATLTVVASTVTPPQAEPAEASLLRSALPARKRQRLRSGPSARGRAAIAKAPAATTAAAWVDPFAEPASAPRAVKAKAHTKLRPATTRTGVTTWVDPFVD